jgi:AMMECR1 domain-containing protein
MKNTELTELVKRINASDEWNAEDLAELCEMAGLEKEWQEADGETFEQVVFKAAEILNVRIN